VSLSGCHVQYAGEAPNLAFTAGILPGRHLKPKLGNLALAPFHLNRIFHRPNHAGAIEGRSAIVLLEERLAVLNGGLVEVGALGGEGRDGVPEGGLRREMRLVSSPILVL
jgi:hypothetical protein